MVTSTCPGFQAMSQASQHISDLLHTTHHFSINLRKGAEQPVHSQTQALRMTTIISAAQNQATVQRTQTWQGTCNPSHTLGSHICNLTHTLTWSAALPGGQEVAGSGSGVVVVRAGSKCAGKWSRLL